MASIAGVPSEKLASSRCSASRFPSSLAALNGRNDPHSFSDSGVRAIRADRELLSSPGPSVLNLFGLCAERPCQRRTSEPSSANSGVYREFVSGPEV